jgi:hypothetical protein
MGSLGGNNIGDAGARDFGAALRVNTTLTTLGWGLHVDVGWGGVNAAEREPQCSDSHMGSLWNNNNIGDEGARDLGAALRVNTTLTTL